MLPSINEYADTLDPASIVEFEILHPGPTSHPGPITTFGPIIEVGSILADLSTITLPFMLSAEANKPVFSSF